MVEHAAGRDLGESEVFSVQFSVGNNDASNHYLGAEAPRD